MIKKTRSELCDSHEFQNSFDQQTFQPSELFQDNKIMQFKNRKMNNITHEDLPVSYIYRFNLNYFKVKTFMASFYKIFQGLILKMLLYFVNLHFRVLLLAILFWIILLLSIQKSTCQLINATNFLENFLFRIILIFNILIIELIFVKTISATCGRDA